MLCRWLVRVGGGLSGADQVLRVVLVGAKAGVGPDPVLRDEAVRWLTSKDVEAA